MDLEALDDVVVEVCDLHDRVSTFFQSIPHSGENGVVSSNPVDVLDALSQSLTAVLRFVREDESWLTVEIIDWMEELMYHVELFRDTMDGLAATVDNQSQPDQHEATIVDAESLISKIMRLQDSVSLPLQLIAASLLLHVIDRTAKRESCFIDQKACEDIYNAFALNESVAFFDHGPFSPLCDRHGPQSCLYLIKNVLDPFVVRVQIILKSLDSPGNSTSPLPAAMQAQSRMYSMLQLKIGARLTLLKASGSYNIHGDRSVFSDEDLDWAMELLPPANNWLRVVGQCIGDGVRVVRKSLASFPSNDMATCSLAAATEPIESHKPRPIPQGDMSSSRNDPADNSADLGLATSNPPNCNPRCSRSSETLDAWEHFEREDVLDEDDFVIVTNANGE